MQLVHKIIKTKETLLTLLYPPVCPLCGCILDIQEPGRLCPECRETAPFITEPRCKRCSKQLIVEEQEYCRDCSGNGHQYVRGLALWANSGAVKKSLYQFKYYNCRSFADIYIGEFMRLHRKAVEAWGAEGIIPVPLHKSRKRGRGFNQAEVLAYKLGKELNIPVYAGCIERTKKTRPQKELNRKERRNNLKKAFKILSFDVKLRKVIVIDDIYTTGSTIDSVAEILKQNGIKEIYFITISIGEGL